MWTYERIKNFKDEDFQINFGVKVDTFFAMLEALEKAYNERHRKGGRPLSKLSILDKLVITLTYYREYCTMQHLSFEYGVSKMAISKTVNWVEGVLLKDPNFTLPSKKILQEDNEIQAVIIDATESPIQRPKKNQEKFYSGKKRHTLKTKIIVDAATLDICTVDIAPGSVHDFELYKQSNLGIRDDIQLTGDKGYQGIQKIHANSLIPFSNSVKKPLSEIQRAYNSWLSSNRVKIEHVNAYLKRFRIVSASFRNSRSQYAKKIKLICGIYNFQHS